MRGVMDEFTHLKNFSKPVDPSLIIAVAARYFWTVTERGVINCKKNIVLFHFRDDAYVPRDGYQPLDQIWPGCEIRFVDCGHVSAYVLHQKLFKKTIAEAVDRYRAKYNVDGTLRQQMDDLIDPTPRSRKSSTDSRVMDVIGLENSRTPTDSPHRL